MKKQQIDLRVVANSKELTVTIQNISGRVMYVQMDGTKPKHRRPLQFNNGSSVFIKHLLPEKKNKK